MKKFSLFLGLIVIVLIAIGGLAVYTPEESIEQPINFSHKFHIGFDIDCKECHRYYKKYAVAGMPDVNICMECHEGTAGKNPEKKKIQEYAKNGQEISWVRLYELPPHLNFTHKRHFRKNVQCQECHGKVEESVRMISMVTHTMENCIACHEKMDASTDCMTCHK